MAAIDFTEFHELAEQFKGEMRLKEICEQEGVHYRSYIAWRSKKGISTRQSRIKNEMASAGMVELSIEEKPQEATALSMATATCVHIEFSNGLKFDRSEMDVDALIEFLTKIRGALCLG